MIRWSVPVSYTHLIDHAPIMPTFAIPEDFGTEEGYRKKYTEKDLFDELDVYKRQILLRRNGVVTG